MPSSMPAFEATNAFRADLLSNLDLLAHQGLAIIRGALNTSTLATPIAAQSQTLQFAVNDAAGTGNTRDFSVVVSITETTGNSSPAPNPAFTETD